MYLTFAWRYFRAIKSTNAINIISWVSMTAIVVGSAALIIVLSVFNGFEDMVKSLYSTFYTDIRISPRTGKIITLNAEQIKKLSATPGVKGVSLVAEDRAWIQNGNQPSIVFLKGVDSNYVHLSGVADHLVRGSFDLGNASKPGLVLGSGIESALGVQSEREISPLTVYLFKTGEVLNTSDPSASLSSENAATTGTFVIQQEFDNKYVFTNLEFMKQMLALKQDEYSSADIQVIQPENTDRIKLQLQQELGTRYLVQTRYEQNSGLFSVMKTENWVIYGVLSLILVVASFNMVGALTMLVLEKQKDIHVLKAMGARNSFIQKIFLSEGILLSLIGGITGILLAVLIAWAQVHYKLVPLEGNSFLVDYYPIQLKATDFLLVILTILVVAVLASWIPARKAAAEPIELRS